MGDCSGDKGGLLMGVQIQQNNWKWRWQNQGSVGCVWGNIITARSELRKVLFFFISPYGSMGGYLVYCV